MILAQYIMHFTNLLQTLELDTELTKAQKLEIVLEVVKAVTAMAKEFAA